ncbi:hypothetical protein AB0F07_15750 [Streptomyces fructofermentans]|uniref:hypothetical protein n=1 Tax=Streptomyces fructofermentans TaxID=152141 RepID=UPI0033C2DC7F
MFTAPAVRRTPWPHKASLSRAAAPNQGKTTMMPYTAQVQFLGSLAILTLCPDGCLVSEADCRQRLGRVLGVIPACLDSLVLDVGRLPGSDLAAVTEAVRVWAVDRRASVVLLGGADPALLVRGSTVSDAADIRRSVDARALVQRAWGIGRAREVDHPCSRR